jgi:hypothetical protein
MERKAALGIGVSNFDLRRERGSYYIDKTLLIKDLFDNEAGVTLITRPRRFGKTLNMDMLKSFFEYNCELRMDNQDKRHLFNGLKIEKAGEKYMKHCGQYPVIFLSLKDTKADTWEVAYHSMKECLYYEYERHSNIGSSKKISVKDKKRLRRFLNGEALDSDFQSAIKFLSDCLFAHYGRQVVLLIDEYDVPLESAFTKNYYEKMISLIRSLFSTALKDNKALAFAVMTGCLRITKESIFTGLNNPSMVSILNNRYSEHFGFTQQEVDEMLEYYDLTSKRDEIREWYDGYLFGETEVYNPWSVINYVSDLTGSLKNEPKAYWANTSANAIIHQMISMLVDNRVQSEMETLIKGGTIAKVINEAITYTDAFSSVDNLWNLLFFTGYLKPTGEKIVEDGVTKTVLIIPNYEVSTIYNFQIREWFRDAMKQYRYPEQIIAALKAGEAATVETLLSDALLKSISYYDTAEKFYHGYLTALLTFSGGYDVKSNREMGDGRSDLVMIPRLDGRMPIIIIEIKIARKRGEMEALSRAALQQIEDKRYADEFIAEGYRTIRKFGVAFFHKECVVTN